MIQPTKGMDFEAKSGDVTQFIWGSGKPWRISRAMKTTRPRKTSENKQTCRLIEPTRIEALQTIVSIDHFW